MPKPLYTVVWQHSRAWPQTFKSEKAAIRTAERIAKRHPNQTYIVFEEISRFTHSTTINERTERARLRREQALVLRQNGCTHAIIAEKLEISRGYSRMLLWKACLEKYGGKEGRKKFEELSGWQGK
jgi:hypothetical protein